MYLTPEFCEKVLKVVTDRICDTFDRFQTVHGDFLDGGTCSLIGHSLGSVIVWDLLSILKDNSNLETEGDERHKDYSSCSLPLFKGSTPSSYQAFIDETDDHSDIKFGTWGPSITEKLTKTIPFIPKFSWFLGSPLGMFLSLRGAQPLFNDMRLKSLSDKGSTTEENDNYPSSPFSLPSGSVYNIFHASDPVAYRIEPLLLPPETPQSEIPSPPFLVPGSTGLRLHVRAKQLGDNLLKTVTGIFQGQMETLPNTLTTNLESRQKDKESNNHVLNKVKPKLYNFALGGKSSRVDFQLQPSIVENEYLSAISAHASYFFNDDMLEFLIECANSD